LGVAIAFGDRHQVDRLTTLTACACIAGPEPVSNFVFEA
jgi:hypothetical protein